MKLGICFPYELKMADALDVVVAAERSGIDSVWVVENPYWPGAFSTCGAVASRTEDITIGLGVVSAFTRSLAVLAMEASNVQQLADGRFVFGLGASAPEVLTNLGIDARHLANGMEEALPLVAQLMRDGVVHHDGDRFRLRDVALSFDAGSPPPLYVGSVGPRMLEVAARHADGVIMSTHAPVAFVSDAVARVQAATQAVDRTEALGVTAFVVACVREDPAAARAELKPKLAKTIGRFAGKPSLERLLVAGGMPEDRIHSIADAMAVGADPRRAVSDEEVDAFCVAGDVGAVQRRLVELQSAGVDEVVLFEAAEDPAFFEEYVAELVAAAAQI